MLMVVEKRRKVEKRSFCWFVRREKLLLLSLLLKRYETEPLVFYTRLVHPAELWKA